MMTIVFGGAASGKSEYAEQLACEGSSKRIYLATMRKEPSAEKRIQKHVDRRKEMGFLTVEDPFLRESGQLPEDHVILLEDLPNLLANRMFFRAEDPDGSGNLSGAAGKEPDDSGNLSGAAGKEPDGSGNLPGDSGLSAGTAALIQEIEADILGIASRAEHFILVSGNLFQDGTEYVGETEEYLNALGKIHRDLAKQSDCLVEVVCGIPIKQAKI